MCMVAKIANVDVNISSIVKSIYRFSTIRTTRVDRSLNGIFAISIHNLEGKFILRVLWKTFYMIRQTIYVFSHMLYTKRR